MKKRFEIYAQLAAVVILVGGCLLVLRPFMTAMLFAAVVCVSTWPMYLWLLRKLKNRQNLAALSMTLSLILVVILPLALVAYNLADNVTAFYDTIRQSMEAGPPEPPAWLTGLPLLGRTDRGVLPRAPPTKLLTGWNTPRRWNRRRAKLTR